MIEYYLYKGGRTVPYDKYVPVIKALSDTTRLQIVDMISCGDLCACKILEKFSITQPTLSYHMKILTECGLVDARRDGAWMHYSINQDKGEAVLAFLSKLMTIDENGICCKAGEACE